MMKCFFAIVVYRFLLDLIYENVISNIWEYAGFFNQYSIENTVVSWCIFMILTILYVYFVAFRRNISKYVVHFWFFFNIIPFTTFIQYGMCSDEFIICNTAFWLCFLLTYICISNIEIPYINHITAQINRIKNSGYILPLFMVMISTVVIFIWIRYSHCRLMFDIINVYEIRAEAAEYDLPLMLRYLYGWSNYLIPVITGYYIIRKKYCIAIFLIFIQFLGFSISGSKSGLLLEIFVIVVCFFKMLDMHKIEKIVFFFPSIMIILVGVGYFIFNDIYAIGILVRRLMFLPIQLMTYYFDFFSYYPPDFYDVSVGRYFGAISDYPDIAKIIGWNYLHVDTHANNGLLSDALMNWGKLGIIIIPILLSIVFKLLDIVYDERYMVLNIVIALYVANTLINTALFTVLLTHGLIPVIIILLFIKSENVS